MANIYDMNAAIDKPNLLGALQQGIGFGNQQRALREQRADEATLRQLAPQIMGGDMAAFEQAAVIDPARAGQFQGAGNVKWQTLKGGVNLVKQAVASGKPEAAQAAWSQFRPYIQKVTGVAPPENWAEAAPHFQQLEMRLASIEGATPAGDLPTGYREAHMKAIAAGYQPGTPEYQNAMRVGLGTVARQVGGARKTGTIRGLDGLERPWIFDPTSGEYTIFDGNAWRPMGASEIQQAESIAPPQGSPQQGATPVTVTQPGEAPPRIAGPADNDPRIAQMNAIRATLQAQNLPPQAINAALDAFEQQAFPGGFEVEPSAPAQSFGGLAIGRSPEAQAGLTKQAEEEVAIANLPRRGAIEAENAALKESATTTAKATAERDAKRAQQAIDQMASLELLDGAEVLLQRATGGQAEQFRDRALGFFGQSTEGSRATAGLRILAAKLVAKVPRMEGPQSDADRLMYQQAAGDLANDALPVGDRLAALQVMRDIARRYSQLNPSSSQGTAQPTRIRYDAQGNRL